MARGGQFRDRVTFQAEAKTPDGAGGNTRAWANVANGEVWGRFIPEKGSERVAGGRLQDAQGAVLRVRSFSVTEAITPAHRVLIDGVAWNIRSVANPDRRSKVIEMVLDKGGARGAAT